MTQLTSTTEEMLRNEQNIQTTIEEAVLNYATLTQQAGLDGVVCSPLEAELLTNKLGSNFLKVTPGITTGAAVDDQKRITTPEDAKQLGQHRIVGRPITQSENPVESYHTIKESWLVNMAKEIAKIFIRSAVDDQNVLLHLKMLNN